MDRSLLHGGPARSTAGFPQGLTQGHQDARASQDARTSQDAGTNFAVQPATTPVTFKLKKKAVKIVGAAGPTPTASRPKAPLRISSSSSMATTSVSTPAPSPASWLGKAQQVAPKENEQLPLPLFSVSTGPTSPPSKIELPPQPTLPSSSLDDMFARLSATTPEPSRPAKEISLSGPDKSFFSFEDRADTAAPSSKGVDQGSPKSQIDSKPAPALSEPGSLSSQPKQSSSASKASEGEAEYFGKAVKYFNTLPSRPGSATHTIQTVANKLHAAYAPGLAKIRPEEVEKLKARYSFAIVTFINNKVKLNPKPVTTAFVNSVLRDSNGNFLHLCAALVTDKYIALDSLEHITNMCRNVLAVLPKADDSVVATSKVDTAAAPAITVAKADPTTPADPMENMKAWPSQEKREHGAIYRACILKGVGGVKTLNELQALVWGGRLESIFMPEPGSENAVVKFLTPEGCQAYLNATQNGIEIQGGMKKTVVFVNQQPEPNSINDVIQNCIDGNVTRCIRATGADDDWSNGMLFNLARGKQKIPRDVEHVKQGKTARGHHYIEIRFGNVHHALNFKNYLMRDEEWEQCTITYSPDPCELAKGVHYDSADN
ncbi:hypothetical protein C7974DRAFT_414115 [Boeremia exigua]|uniref:uncharacterized protein n=1 Tax=Boeremia exigua TaxID=749465 RepID=UPI001E8E25B7|nr:uncharacterized protein C7974DRAFT_414115 [Boeremia exigua]KAH6625614.1 hypothetical protein C7974DRAFT_414115 [Boeremia exigua]